MVAHFGGKQLWTNVDVSLAVEYPIFGNLDNLLHRAIKVGVGFCSNYSFYQLSGCVSCIWFPEKYLLVVVTAGER